MSKIGRGNKITGKRENNRFGSDRVRKKMTFRRNIANFYFGDSLAKQKCK